MWSVALLSAVLRNRDGGSKQEAGSNRILRDPGCWVRRLLPPALIYTNLAHSGDCSPCPRYSRDRYPPILTSRPWHSAQSRAIGFGPAAHPYVHLRVSAALAGDGCLPTLCHGQRPRE